jgi:hypothetical protein
LERSRRPRVRLTAADRLLWVWFSRADLTATYACQKEHSITTGRLRRVPLTRRLTAALGEHRHLRSARVLCQDTTEPADAADRANTGEACRT